MFWTIYEIQTRLDLEEMSKISPLKFICVLKEF